MQAGAGKAPAGPAFITARLRLALVLAPRLAGPLPFAVGDLAVCAFVAWRLDGVRITIRV